MQIHSDARFDEEVEDEEYPVNEEMWKMKRKVTKDLFTRMCRMVLQIYSDAHFDEDVEE